MTFKPLLAATVPAHDALGDLPYPLMWSPKLDGIRTMIRQESGGPVTRKLKSLPNDKVRELLSDDKLFGMDGECLFGNVTDPDVFNRTQSAVMTIAGPGFDEADGKLLVFDDFTNPEWRFEDRFKRLEDRVAALQGTAPYIKIVPHRIVENELDLINVERLVVERGYEGVMVRSLDGRYKHGRSTLREMILGKIKRFTDAEATVVGFEELMHNDNEQVRDELGHAKRSTHAENLRPGGTLGALIVNSAAFDEKFKIGSGFSAADKQRIWDNRGQLLGATVTFKYQESGMKDLPRFPVFKGFRVD